MSLRGRKGASQKFNQGVNPINCICVGRINPIVAIDVTHYFDFVLDVVEDE